ncbi:MAG: YceI family protein, partial [Polaromonas sp.]|nr:YceI family protein [Gemmatimonadaceae bacterium]
VTKAVVLDGHFNGIQKGSGQQTDRVGFDASTTINRLDYGVKWNRVVEGGGVTLGDEVKIEINVEAVRAKS